MHAHPVKAKPGPSSGGGCSRSPRAWLVSDRHRLRRGHPFAWEVSRNVVRVHTLSFFLVCVELMCVFSFPFLSEFPAETPGGGVPK